MTDLLGNGKVKERLKMLVEKNRVPHLMLFSGPDGVGKKEYAKWFASYFLSKISKKQVSTEHPDISIYKPEGKLGMHSIDSIRRFIHNLPLTSFELKAKFVIIDDAERMLPSSSNALLKTLEEPPEGCYIILVSSDKERLLPTIFSRVSEIRFSRVDDQDIFSFLQHHHKANDQDLLRLAKRAEGSFSNALSLCEKLQDDTENELIEFLLAGGVKSFHMVQEFVEKVDKRYAEKRKALEKEFRKKVKDDLENYNSQQKHIVEQEIEGALSMQFTHDIHQFFSDIASFYRDVEASQYIEIEHLQKKELSVVVDLDRVLEAIAKARKALERSTPLKQVLEALFLEISL